MTIKNFQKLKDREQELIELSNYASESEIEGIVLVPLNDGTIVDNKTQKELLQSSLKSIINILDDYNLIGYIKTIGFKTSSLKKNQ